MSTVYYDMITFCVYIFDTFFCDINISSASVSFFFLPLRPLSQYLV